MPIKVPEDITDNWAGWYLIVKGIVTLEELETHWSIDDVDFALEAYLAIEDANRRAEKQTTGN